MAAPAETTPNVLEVVNLSKAFLSAVVLSDLSINVRSGEVHVLVGQNGSGKSTLIKILSGFHTPTSYDKVAIGGVDLETGNADHSYRLGCRFVHQDLGLIDSLPVVDNLLMTSKYPTWGATIVGRKARRYATEMLQLVALDLDPNRMVSTLTPTQKTEIAIARALGGNPAFPARLLVLDEPTATLPPHEVDRLMATLRRVTAAGIGVLYVTHHLDEIDRIGTTVSVLRDGVKVHTSRVDQIERRDLINALVGKELAKVQRESTKTTPLDRPVLEVSELSAGSATCVSFIAGEGEIVGLAGRAGSGRESILGGLFGALPVTGGAVRVSGVAFRPSPPAAMKNRVAYLPGDRKTQGGILAMTVQENLTLADLRPVSSRLRLRHAREAAEVRQWSDRLDVRPRRPKALLQELSGGNQQKVLLGKWLRLNPLVLLLDDPTQGVDVGAKAEIHRLLLDASNTGTTVVLNSSDIEELSMICDRVLVIRGGVVTSELSGAEVSVRAINESLMGEVS